MEAGGERAGLKTIRALRSPLWRHCFPKPASPKPGGSTWAWGLAWAGGEGAARAGSVCRQRSWRRLEQVGQAWGRAALWQQAWPCCQGISGLRLGGSQQQKRVKAQDSLTCSPGGADSGERRCEWNPLVKLVWLGKGYCCTWEGEKLPQSSQICSRDLSEWQHYKLIDIPVALIP